MSTKNPSNTSNTYLAAANAVRSHVTARQAELDLAAQTARTAHIAALRSAPLAGVSTDSPLYPLASLLSQTVTVGRESDGYPGARGGLSRVARCPAVS